MKIVERDEVQVMFKRTSDVQAAITGAWDEVERAIGSLRGRRFYGAYDPRTREYWVCVHRQDGDDAEALGLEEGELPGGRFARERLVGEPPAVYALIRPTFERLAACADTDELRQSIEDYRRRDEIDLLLPVR